MPINEPVNVNVHFSADENINKAITLNGFTNTSSAPPALPGFQSGPTGYGASGGTVAATHTIGSFTPNLMQQSPVYGGVFQTPPLYGDGEPWAEHCDALGHVLDPDTAREEDTAVVGACMTCHQSMRVERIPGGMEYFRAGRAIGKAMSLDDGDDDGLAELLGELKKIETVIAKEVEKLRRAKQLITLSRSIVTKKVFADAEASLTAD